MFIVDSALQHTCAEISEQGIRGHLSPAERDLLIDGAILLAVHLDALAQDGHDDMPAAWHEASAASAGRHAAGGRMTTSPEQPAHPAPALPRRTSASQWQHGRHRFRGSQRVHYRG